MTAKRDRVDIIHDMLDIIRRRDGTVKPTQIMYKANLSHSMLNDYMAEIKAKGFIVENVDKKGRKTYSLTEKGNVFLRDYYKIREFFDSYGLN